MKEKSCGAIIYNNKNEVLIIKQTTGHWGFPKGHVEENETEIETALREVKEETNLNIEILDNYRYEDFYIVKENVEKTVVFFLAKNISENLIKQDAEVTEMGWYSYEEALKILTYANTKEILIKSYNDWIKQ